MVAVRTIPAPHSAPGRLDLLDAIATRTSVRDYLTALVPRTELELLRAYGETAEALSDDTLRVHLVVDGASIQNEVKGILGDYGRMIFAPHYIALTALESPTYLVECGYRFEQMILEAHARGWGTCWIGGWFNEDAIRRLLGIPADERVVALTPIGIPAAKRSFLGNFVKVAVRSSSRKKLDELCSWIRVGQPVPHDLWDDARVAKMFEAVRWGPSWANKQPWRFVLEPTSVLLYKEAKLVKEDKDYFLVDAGIAMAHLHLAARVLGFEGSWKLESGTVPGGKPNAEVIGRYTFPRAIF